MHLILSIAALVISLDQAAAQQAPTTPNTAATATSAPRRLDGRFDDWANLDRLGTRWDPSGDASGPDLTIISLASDPNDFWMLVEFANPVTIAGLDTPLVILIDTDGYPYTGAKSGRLVGADLAIVCSPDANEAPPPPSGGASGGPPPSKEHGEGLVVRRINDDGSMGDVVANKDLGVGVAPAHASRRFEFRIPRSADRLQGMNVGVLAALVERVDASTVRYPDEFDVARALLVPLATTTTPKAHADLIARASDTRLRVASWNAELGALFKTPEPFATTLKALAPDVVLFQELGAKATAADLAGWMNTHVGTDAGEWRALVSGGDLRTGIVARRELSSAPFLDGLKRATPKGDRPVRITGAILDIDGKKLLLASLHLKCCGRLQSSEDETRLGEAAAIRDAIRQAKEKVALDGVVVAGDFNLVGDPAVIDVMGAALDLDASALDTVDAFQPDGIENATWRSTGNRFLPGRLDWILISGASLKPAKCFVFATDDFDGAAIEAMKLPASALKEPSDHLPVVVDLTLVTPQK